MTQDEKIFRKLYNLNTTIIFNIGFLHNHYSLFSQNQNVYLYKLITLIKEYKSYYDSRKIDSIFNDQERNKK